MVDKTFKDIVDGWRGDPVTALAQDVNARHPVVGELFAEFLAQRPQLGELGIDILRAYGALVRCYDGRGALYLCGNGGSMADCVHIAGELIKSFERDRSIGAEDAEEFEGLPHGEELAANLESGLPAIALGMSVSLATAVANDNQVRDISFAQELFGMRPTEKDMLWGISTSGNSTNVVMAMSVAKALGLTTIALTGEGGGTMGEMADVAIRAPAKVTKTVQEHHLPIYHVLCAMIEAHYWPQMRTH